MAICSNSRVLLSSMAHVSPEVLRFAFAPQQIAASYTRSKACDSAECGSIEGSSTKITNSS